MIDDDCECGHDRDAHRTPTMGCARCDCPLWMPPDVRAAVDYLSRQPRTVREMAARAIRASAAHARPNVAADDGYWQHRARDQAGS